MSLNRGDPFHLAVIGLMWAAVKLVDDLHDYEHWLSGRESDLFSLRDVEKDYEQIVQAWEQFREAMGKIDPKLLSPGDPS